MAIAVDIADRLYDYTDEEKAAEAVAEFQFEKSLDDQAIISIWQNPSDPLYTILEKRIIEAVDRNGSAKRAQESVPSGVSLLIEAADV